jgi:hypothetical protein
VLEVTKEFSSRSLWVKGAHLSRSVYEPHYFRHFGDLDVIIDPTVLDGFVKSLRDSGFSSFHTPAYCNQIGVGPVSSPLDVLKAPLQDWIPAGAITMHRKSDSGLVDIKVGPFERGVQAVEFERMFADAEHATCLGRTYLAPSQTDHLLIMLCNFAKNRFKTWRTLLDIHMLVVALNKKPESWQRFVQACKIESITTTAWASLAIAVDRLSTPVPNTVLDALAPTNKLFSTFFTFTIEPAFVWNSTSLPMMVLNACASADRKRKLDLLTQSIFPSSEFLTDYYGDQTQPPQFVYLRRLLKHWYVLFMPAGVVRRTFGRYWWSSEPKF